jgi:nicotinate-nucleotide adenylyltransferase
MTYGVFGGSFDPPHLAHAMACLWALESGAIDRVILIPVAVHAFGKTPGANFAHRLAMCRLVAARFGDAVEVNDTEGRRAGTSFMIDTLRELHRERPRAGFRLIAGSDVVGEIPKWRESAEVLRLAPVLEIPRPGGGAALPNALPDISSSIVRDRLRAGLPMEGWLSANVSDYIRSNGLYT